MKGACARRAAPGLVKLEPFPHLGAIRLGTFPFLVERDLLIHSLTAIHVNQNRLDRVRAVSPYAFEAG